MERLQEIATRKAEIKAMLEANEEVDLDAIKEELDSLDAEERSLNYQMKEDKEAEGRKRVEAEMAKADKEAEERRNIADAINERKLNVKEIKGEKEMEVEIRNTPEYVNAYAEYIKTGKEAEVRSLLTENVSGTIAVPDFVLDEVKTAWDNEQLFQHVKKTYFKGNLKVNFEISGDGAVKHLEGSQAVTEEELVEGIVTLTPVSIKKWISISDEVYDLRGESFLRYIYSELGYRIAKKCADEVVTCVASLTAAGSSTSPKQTLITVAPSMATVATALGNLTDEATNPIIVMNKLTWSAFKTVQYANNYAVDPFEGLTVVFNNTLPAYGTADANDVYMIVGDFNNGFIANLPNGEGIDFKFDELSKKKEDLIEVLGRTYVGMGAVACDHFCLVKKPAASV